ncbi:MAG: sugar ABC transporter substrate-binding protein [Pseudomonadales bacterium]|jgi:ribose transport system substrate-binding protein|nr:sugar ABC transporter substrate-binding protein [Pseudomonadales bacterium]MDP7594840.1 sugar ABC transporter substrate-binding protein [Pseudomonadales bacterium]HJN51786.1 sugar ABC transporter substrate-binding protein [Pseudomonadales bacterium]|tara:strand:- start:10898 stop:11836 length:939 start_codon:yes stop_codon:yes gene_type:complete
MSCLRWLALPTLLLLASCGGEESGPAKPQVALIMKSLANEFFSTMAAGAERHQAENSRRYDLIVNGIKDERDLSRQVALVDEMIARGVQAIVIAPADSKALAPALGRASEAGIVVINIDNKLDIQVLEQEGLAIPFVGPDNRAGARKVGDHLAQALESGMQVIVLEGTRSSFNAQQRRLGFEDAMRDAGIVIADSQSANWEMAQANTFTTSMLAEYPQARAVLASNDSMALGALAAVKAAGREGEVTIVGFDNITAVQAAIREGRILATADQHADQLATFGIDYALKLLADSNQTLDDLETPVDLITASSLD